MNKKILFGSILAAVIIALATCTPAVCSADLNNVKKVTIETTIHKFLGKEEIVTEVSEEEAAEIMEYLEYYQQSLNNGDKKLIQKYESLLIDSGIFGKDHNPFSKNDIKSILSERYRSMIQSNPPSPTINNRFCFVNAQGKGNLTFAFDGLFDYLITSGALLLVFCILLPPLFPIFGPLSLILIFGGGACLFVNHLRPFRILHPQLELHLDTGDCSITGLNGVQQFSAPVEAVFSGFNGLTVNFLTKDRSVFLLGFALRSEVL